MTRDDGRLVPGEPWEQWCARIVRGSCLARDCDDLERLLDGWRIRHWRIAAITHERRLLQRSEAA